MATITSVRVPDTLQTLIDSRLDTIDRMLVGRLPRSERLEIVREVESQIFELLQERTSDEPTREDVLAVLARLDPPEAYLPDELGNETGDRPRPAIGASRPTQPHASPGKRRAALTSGILGIVTIVLLLLIFPVVIGLANILNIGPLILFVWYVPTLITLVSSIGAIWLAVHSRFQSYWGVTGLILGIIDLIWSLGFVVLGVYL
jgi:hypothetical protein